ncbi:hypothetical protein NUW58_g6552 [Xylaria curta]|uniref:Uncharacterized protein n=1 Tax=Xylaria curta TaxID=42375 RepID=A0ACC1NRP7_9PEZI|nr:hypothetical protein NUW58_g6552 [Xylaria curta]
METSLLFMILQTFCFILTWMVVDHRVSHHGPISGAREWNKMHSRVYSAVSAVLFYLTLSPGHSDGARILYHYSKFWEYIDVLTVRASGGVIDLHFGFHHLTTPYLTFFRVLPNIKGWRVFAALNTAHHAFMYAYFGGAAFLHPLLDYTGCIQLLVGIGMEMRVLWSTEAGEAQSWPHMVAAGLLSSYLVLWAREMNMRRDVRHRGNSKAKSP